MSKLVQVQATNKQGLSIVFFLKVSQWYNISNSARKASDRLHSYLNLDSNTEFISWAYDYQGDIAYPDHLGWRSDLFLKVGTLHPNKKNNLEESFHIQDLGDGLIYSPKSLS